MNYYFCGTTIQWTQEIKQTLSPRRLYLYIDICYEHIQYTLQWKEESYICEANLDRDLGNCKRERLNVTVINEIRGF